MGPSLAKQLAALTSLLVAVVFNLAPPLPAPTDPTADSGLQMQPASPLAGSIEQPDALAFFTARHGPPAARWPEALVTFCTAQVGRPDWLGPEQFRSVVRRAAAMWTAQGAHLTVAYSGDCEAADGRWAARNRTNEVGFDDEREAVQGRAAGLARGTWRTISRDGVTLRREFVEFDVILRRELDVPLRCLETVVRHEMGHALGLGHGEDGGLMRSSFDRDDLTTCTLLPSRAERDALRLLYPPLEPARHDVLLMSPVTFEPVEPGT